MSRPRRFQDSVGYPPRYMRAERAAAYLDISRSKFLELVGARRLPKPKAVDGIRVWDRLALETAMDDFTDPGDSDNNRPNSFDAVLGGL